MLALVQSVRQLMQNHVPLSPTVWFRISQLLVYLTAALKFLEIVVFSQSSMLCNFNATAALANSTRTSYQDYVTAYCNLQSKRFAMIPFGTFDSLMILVATGVYLVIIREIKTQLEVLRQHVEAFPVEILSSTSCRLSSVDRDKLIGSQKWQQTRKRLLILVAVNACMIFVIGAVLYFSVMGNVEFLKPFDCDFSTAMPDAKDLHEVTCILAEVALLEFLHASNFFLNVIGSATFTLLGLSTLNFLRKLQVDGIVNYESEKFDLERKGEMQEDISALLNSGDLRTTINKAKSTMVGKLVQRVLPGGLAAELASSGLVGGATSSSPIDIPAPSTDDPSERLLRSTPLD